MNGRTCQLCGKSLSRFSVGSGGDFCSREHRNQFRLRLGMDRLMEANKVSSLMRRRENAKIIPAAQLMRDSKVGPRVAPVLRLPVRQPDAPTLHLEPAKPEKPTIAARAGTLISSAAPAAPMRSAARPADRGPFQARPIRPMPAPRAERFSAKLAPAGSIDPRLAVEPLEQLRRDAAELRLALHGTPLQVKPPHATPRNCQEPRPARRLATSADRGRELRVSGGIGFRLSSPRIRSVGFVRPATTQPGGSTAARSLRPASRTLHSDVQEAGLIRFAVRGPSGPEGPDPAGATGFRFPGAVHKDGEPASLDDSVSKTCGVPWIAPAPRPPQLRHRNGTVRLRPLKPEAPGLPAPPPRGISTTRRLTVVSFQPRETPFVCSPSALYGTLLSQAHFGATPVRKAEPAPATMEEHFDAGLRNWVGGTGDWKVDVAGVRAGSLALYAPSLELPNYLLEFLTRIETRGVTWVFRAANTADYYKANLAVTPGGGYDFHRCLVQGGKAQEPVTRSIPPASPAPTGKTAVTVRTRVAGNEFSVSIDGQVIDTWADARLTAGGIGFVGAPEERARLYWVKVTPIALSSKEYSKR